MQKTESSFMTKKNKIPALVSAIKGNVENVPTLTENGALTNSSTNSALLDFFALAGAMRSRPEADITALFEKAYYADRANALKCAFYFRDARGGQGERKVFRAILKWLALHDPELAKANLKNIPFFGRWDDVFAFVDTALENDAFQLLHNQLFEDQLNMRKAQLELRIFTFQMPP